jgi:parallel beta-helix repeat protein
MKRKISIYLLSIILVLSFVSSAFAAAATMYVTPAGAGLKNGTTWANAFGYTEWETDAEGASEAGDIYYVAGGTYTLTSNFIGRDGTAAAPITYIGVKAGTTNEPPLLSDWATGDDRPLIAGGNYYFSGGSYNKVFGIRVTATGTYGINGVYYAVYFNCKVSGTPTTAIYSLTGTKVINCELTGTTGVVPGGAGASIMFSYIHGCENGISLNTNNLFILNNVIDNCSGAGIALAASTHILIMNNTIHNTVRGITATTANLNILINNVINDCATAGASWGTQENNNIWINNNFEGNGANVNIATALPHSDWAGTANDPLFNNAANGLFDLQDASLCYGSGLALALGIGNPAYMNQGAWQKSNVPIAGGGGGVWGLIR